MTPDIYLPDPLSSQSYNRHSHVANNPLRYTDPTGFLPSPADHKAKGSAQPDGGTAAPAPAPSVLCGLVAPVTLIRAKADDTGNTPPEPPAVSRAEQEGKWTELMKHMAWGAARQLLSSAPPVVAARNIQHNFQLAASAARSAREGDWGQAFSTLLEMPEKTALGAARVLTGPIDAALSIPASVQAAMNPEVDPEMRGAAMVQGAQAVIAVVAAVVGAAAAVESASSSGSGPKTGSEGGPGAGKRFPASAKSDAEMAADGKCVFCGRETTRAPGPRQRNTDHAIPRSRGGNNSPDNAQNTCRECNQRKGTKTTEEYIRDKK